MSGKLTRAFGPLRTLPAGPFAVGPSLARSMLGPVLA
jgi:hypothetical protein